MKVNRTWWEMEAGESINTIKYYFLQTQWLTIQLFAKQSVILWVKAGKTAKSITAIFVQQTVLLAEQQIRRNIHVKLYRFK